MGGKSKKYSKEKLQEGPPPAIKLVLKKNRNSTDGMSFITMSNVQSPSESSSDSILSKNEQIRLNAILEYLLKELKKKDPQEIFAWPVNDIIAPGYSNMIEEPMDFSKMHRKLDLDEYSSLSDFKRDFELIIENCKKYNTEDTVYYKAAKKIKYSGKKIMGKERLISLRQLLPKLKECPVAEYYAMIGLSPPAKNVEEDIVVDQNLPVEDGNDKFANNVISFTDNDSEHTVAPDSKHAAELARLKLKRKHPHNELSCLLQTNDPSKLELKILNSDQQSSGLKLVDLTAALGKDGVNSLPVVKEDKRNKITCVEYLSFGAFTSFAPTYDSRKANVSQETTDMLMQAYQNQDGYMFASSMRDFVSNASLSVKNYVDDMIDEATNGKHSKYLSKALSKNASLLHKLQSKQVSRMNVKLESNKMKLQFPTKEEVEIAEDLQNSLVKATHFATPGSLVNDDAIKKCYG